MKLGTDYMWFLNFLQNTVKFLHSDHVWGCLKVAFKTRLGQLRRQSQIGQKLREEKWRKEKSSFNKKVVNKEMVLILGGLNCGSLLYTENQTWPVNGRLWPSFKISAVCKEKYPLNFLGKLFNLYLSRLVTSFIISIIFFSISKPTI